MGLGRICDRCGAFYIPEARTIEYGRGQSGSRVNGLMLNDRGWNQNNTNRGEIDLCPACLTSFAKWISMDDHKE